MHCSVLLNCVLLLTKIQIVEFGISESPEIFNLLKVKTANAVILLKKFDEGINQLTEEITVESVERFVAENSEPVITEFSPKTSRKVFQKMESGPNLVMFIRYSVQPARSLTLRLHKSLAQIYTEGKVRMSEATKLYKVNVEDSLNILFCIMHH